MYRPLRQLLCQRTPTIAALALLAVAAILSGVPAAAISATPDGTASSATAPLKIGIIGTGRIGGALARYWAMADNEVLVSSRHPEELQGLVHELGPRAHAGTPQQAAAFGSVVLVSVPYAAMPPLGQDLRSELAGKIIIDTSNPVEGRDGQMAQEAQKLGAGVATAQFLHNGIAAVSH